MIKELLWNDEQHRLRTPWRLTLQVAIVVVLVFIARGGLEVGALLLPGLPDGLAFIVMEGLFGLAIVSAMLFSIWLAGFFLDRRRFADFGIHLGRDWWIDFGFGLVLGAVLMGLVFLVEWAAGWITVTGVFQPTLPDLPFGVGIAATLLGFVGIGVSEELFSRGYHLKNMAEGFGFIPRIGPKGAVVVAALVSSVIFGVAHAPNPNATLVSTLYLSLAGVKLALAYVLTGELAIPIGLHITWNFFQGNVFGFPVSGLDAGATFIAVEQGGDALVTGGAFGPEAGLIGLGAMALGCALIVLWVRLRYGRVGIHERLATPELLPHGQAQHS